MVRLDPIPLVGNIWVFLWEWGVRSRLFSGAFIFRVTHNPFLACQIITQTSVFLLLPVLRRHPKLPGAQR